jgi:hypothetical protein
MAIACSGRWEGSWRAEGSKKTDARGHPLFKDAPTQQAWHLKTKKQWAIELPKSKRRSEDRASVKASTPVSPFSLVVPRKWNLPLAVARRRKKAGKRAGKRAGKENKKKSVAADEGRWRGAGGWMTVAGGGGRERERGAVREREQPRGNCGGSRGPGISSKGQSSRGSDGAGALPTGRDYFPPAYPRVTAELRSAADSRRTRPAARKSHSTLLRPGASLRYSRLTGSQEVSCPPRPSGRSVARRSCSPVPVPALVSLARRSTSVPRLDISIGFGSAGSCSRHPPTRVCTSALR